MCILIQKHVQIHLGTVCLDSYSMICCFEATSEGDGKCALASSCRFCLVSNAKKTKAIAVNLPLTVLQTANGMSFEMVDDFKYLGSWVSSTKQDIRVHKAMPWKALNRMSVV